MEEGLLASSSSSDDVYRKSCSATPAVIFSTSVVACGSLAFGLAVGYSSPAESGIMNDLGLSFAEYSGFSSILKFGGMLGALLSGRVADCFGRRITMWILAIFFILGWILIFFGQNAWWLDFGRLFMGVGCGLHCYVAPIYIGEITPKDIRGGFIAITTFTQTLGFILMFLVGNFLSWRGLAVVGVLPCLAQVLGLFFTPESPRWLAMMGDEKGAEMVLWHLRGANADISSEAAEIEEYAETLEQEPKSRYSDLMDRRYAQPLLVGIGLMLLVQFGGADGVSSYANSIFEAAGCPAAISSTAIAAVQIPFAPLSVLLVDKAGRRPILMVTAAIAGCGMFLTGLGFLFKTHNIWIDISPPLVLAGVMIYSSAMAAGMGSTTWVIMSEIFPINIKGTAGSLVTLGNWFSSWVVAYAFNFLFEWNSSGVFFIFAITSAAVVPFVMKCVPETKGRTLEEIQASMVLFK
ncbi:OLC1v1000594C1 [Oldenlandia corymbosa var. corymbosa]|uniref:OLC1v1000594C1 n=1 Tax=Oldenlandia corymbosa var. corymbosa TaxID=529605 RepID=A0AAV1D425_OLDCO|nr:OLC1v1000594C1 [Oldenlandia corymbosa var. corymbosa]